MHISYGKRKGFAPYLKPRIMKNLPIFLFPLFAACIICQPSFSQEIKWNTAPQMGFVYAISNKQAQKLLTGKQRMEITKNLLHTLVDTFDVKKGWTNRPSKGHFILAKIVGTQLHCEYTSVFPYQVFLLGEYNALSLQVVDYEGNVRDDAKVKFRFERIDLDPESKTYRFKNELFRGEKQFVTVELLGFRSVFEIRKHEVPSWHNYYDDDEGPTFYSYLITDKNKYKPGELVRFKSYALSHQKFPLKKELEIRIYGHSLYKKLGVINPQHPGSYAGEFRLHDSLNLVLDKIYTLELREKGGRIVSSCSFKYEDYELTGNKLDVKLEKNRQYFPENNRITITATDVNGLLLKDAQADILIKTGTIIETFQQVAVLPDTLFFTRIHLNPAQSEVLEIPPGLFQKTNTSYEVIVTVLNSQNQRMEKSQSATYFYSNYELVSGFSNDSICFSLLKNNEPLYGIPISFSHNDTLHSKQVTLPYKEKINPAIRLFHFENELIRKDVLPGSLNPEIDLIGGIQQDSFNIRLKNPHKLEISWFIYQGSNLLSKGFGNEMEYKSVIADRSITCYVELLYSFGGNDKVLRRQYEFKEDRLNVSFNIPERIYPGQQVDAEIAVSNQSGHPVRNVDLTAMAVTGKLDYYIPDLPYYGTSSSPRSKNATYSKKDLNSCDVQLELDYSKWNALASLDTMLYYQFMYPGKNGFNYTISITDSTQFAPFVMQKGKSKQIYVIEVDRSPVYYSWTNHPKGFSFYISPTGRHEITLRLFDRVLVLDSMDFARNTKTIISIDLDNLPEKTKVHELEKAFTYTEITRIKPYVAQFNVVTSRYAYLQSEREFTPVFSKFKSSGHAPNYGTIVAGPVFPEKKTYSESDLLKTTYQHTGGYNYAFEDNIVYKLTPTDLYPRYLYDGTIEPMECISDLVITKKNFLKKQEWDPFDDISWQATTIDMQDPDSRIRIFLPINHKSMNIASLLFRDCQQGKIVPPTLNKFYHNLSHTYYFPAGYHDLIVLYEDGTYLKVDSVPLGQNRNFAIDFSNSQHHGANEKSLSWLVEYIWIPENYGRPYTEKPVKKVQTLYNQNFTGNVSGIVYGEDNEPLPGAVIVVKGTNYGTISDIDGNFSLQIDDYRATITISFIGFVSEEMEVTRGSAVTIQLVPDITSLEEVVVVGYGTQKRMELTGAIASIQGRAAGVSVVPDDEFASADAKPEDDIIKEAEQRLYEELLTLNTIRTHFSDVGFWEPSLLTNKNGKASFQVTFPDDITRWDAVVYAMNRQAQTGTARKSIKSYKPLMAELHVPQFLTRGDSSLLMGKVLNYTADSMIHGSVHWNGLMVDQTRDISFSQYHTNLLPVYAVNTDSISISYSFTRDDGYLDGEERIVPVVEQGIERAEGTLHILKNGDQLKIEPAEDKKVTVTILDNQLDIYEQEVNSLLHYRYDCNEQLASKLIGLISYKSLMQYKGKPFHFDSNVKLITRRLLKNQNREFLWSWWDISDKTSYWMSAHILSALKYAKDAGYEVNLDIENLARKAQYKFDMLKNITFNDIELIHALAGWNVNLNYAKYVPELDSILALKEREEKKQYKNYSYGSFAGYSFLKEKFLLTELRQMKGMPYQRDVLLKYKKEGMLGDVHFSDDKPERYWYSNDMSANAVAYRIIRRDSLLNNLLVPMQMYFMNSRREGVWNTYQASGIIMNVLPDLLKEGFENDRIAAIQLSGKQNETITKFPFSMELQPGESLLVEKKSGIPLYCMQYYTERVTKAKTGIEGFEISAWFRTNTPNLEAGKPVDLVVDVVVNKNLPVEHVMIEVPIPGACSYADKRQEYYGVETYREYFKEKTLICCEKLNPGKYSFSISLLPRFAGVYILNPASVALMYIPVVNANNNMEKVRVRQTDSPINQLPSR